APCGFRRTSTASTPVAASSSGEACGRRPATDVQKRFAAHPPPAPRPPAPATRRLPPPGVPRQKTPQTAQASAARKTTTKSRKGDQRTSFPTPTGNKTYRAAQAAQPVSYHKGRKEG